MSFRGPSGGARIPGVARAFAEERDIQQTAFDRAMSEAQQGARLSSSWAQSVQNMQRQNEEQEEGRARLAMTPGVRQGGRPSGLTVADSPALQSRSFQRYGQSYTYDPAMEAAAEGQGAAVKESTAESTRVESLSRVPGISRQLASRMVYGRSGVLDPEGDASELRQALAEYVRKPSREAGARAVAAGANLNPFLDRFLADGEERPVQPERPVEGTPEYYDMLRKRSDIETEQVRREAPFRASVNAAFRVPPKPNWRGITKEVLVTTKGADGKKDEVNLVTKYGRQNLDTNTIEWEGEPPPGSLADRARATRMPTPFTGKPSGDAPAGRTPPVAPRVRRGTALTADSSDAPPDSLAAAAVAETHWPLSPGWLADRAVAQERVKMAARTDSIAHAEENRIASADRWEELVTGGMDPAAATAQVKREFNQP